MNLAMYILVNSDIKIGTGKLAGQVSHSVEVYHERNQFDNEMIKEYRKARKKIILNVHNINLKN